MSAAKSPWARVSIDLGRYNLAGTEKSWCVTLYTSEGHFSETWPEDEKPDIDGLLPSEVMDLLVERLDSYWIHTGRVEKKARMTAWQEKASAFDDAYLVAQIERLEKQIQTTKRRLNDLRDAEEDALATGVQP